jgi:arylsulfatase
VGQLDDTLLIVMSDNGASQEGGPTGVFDEMRWFNGMPEDVDAAVRRLDDIGGPESHSNVPWGWAQVGNTPLKWYKQNTHGGGVRDPLVIHWPKRLGAPGEFRRTFCHAIDLMPTVLETLGVDMPDEVAGVAQMPLHGVSLLSTFEAEHAKPQREVQYFEMLGHRGIWKEGWKAVTRHEGGKSFDDDVWELYHLDEDFSESHDLASAEPERLKEMVDLWWHEAERHGVLPLDDRNMAVTFRAARRKGSPASRDRFVYYPPISHIVADACPSAARGWTTTVELEHPDGDGDGALVNRGTINSGFALYIRGGRLHFDYNCFHDHTLVAAGTPIGPGRHTLAVKVVRGLGREGDVTLCVDGSDVAKGRIPRLLAMLSSTGMDIGRAIAPVNRDYTPPFAYGGRIDKVTFELAARREAGDAKDEAEREARAAMARQ